MSAAIVDKVPVDLKWVAHDLVKPTEDAFKRAIDAFHLFWAVQDAEGNGRVATLSVVDIMW